DCARRFPGPLASELDGVPRAVAFVDDAEGEAEPVGALDQARASLHGALLAAALDGEADRVAVARPDLLRDLIALDRMAVYRDDVVPCADDLRSRRARIDCGDRPVDLRRDPEHEDDRQEHDGDDEG